MNCIYCHSTQIRLSRLRIPDLLRLLLLKIPVRCRSCQERVYTNIFAALLMAIAPKPRAKRPHLRKSETIVSDDSAAA